jgi:hypothetical protein
MIYDQQRRRVWHGRVSGQSLPSDVKLSTRTDSRRFLWDKERELWDMFQDLDRDQNGVLDAVDMRAALSRAGMELTQATVDDLVRFLASGANTPGTPKDSAENTYITFSEFRDFLIMLPRKATPYEIYKCESCSYTLHTSPSLSGSGHVTHLVILRLSLSGRNCA